MYRPAWKLEVHFIYYEDSHRILSIHLRFTKNKLENRSKPPSVPLLYILYHYVASHIGSVRTVSHCTA